MPDPPSRSRARLLLGAVLALAAAGCTSTAPPVPSVGATSNATVGLTRFAVADRKPAPELSGTGLDGSAVDVGQLGRGHIVVLNIWASWCEPCKEESPALARAANEFGPKGVEFVGLDEQDSLTAARAFASKVGASYPHLVDADGTLLARLTLLPQLGIPSTLIIDPHGRMAARIVGAVTESELSTIIGQLESEA